MVRAIRLATYLWPGLPQLWFEGAWSGLILAASFSLLLNLLLLATLVWVELLAPQIVHLGWLALGAAWTAALAVSAWRGVSSPASAAAESGDLFRQALSEYLQGAWFEAEAICERMLAADPRDVEARLLLATVLRHTQRHDDSRRQIVELERLEGADHWIAEIAVEKELIAAAERQAAAEAESVQLRAILPSFELPDLSIKQAA